MVVGSSSDAQHFALGLVPAVAALGWDPSFPLAKKSTHKPKASAPAPRERIQCPRCKLENSARLDFCTRCGYSFRQTRAQSEAGSSLWQDGDLLGQVINGKYRVLSVLGEGGFGVVYKVEHLLFDSSNIFALKVLHPSLSQDKQFRLRFLREAGLTMSLVHENTIQIREFGQTEESDLFFTMDYCEGEPLKNVIEREEFLTVNRALHITRQILWVMQQAHSQGIIHRDLKPENIFLERRGGQDFVKVGDFGLAKAVDRSEDVSDITRGGILGTPRYMSPEQAKGREDLDGRSDLYSAGVILYEMLYGDVPGIDGGDESTERGGRSHAVPRGVWEVARRALEPKREARYQSADDFLAALDSLPHYAPTYSEPVGDSGWNWRRTVAAVVVVALTVALGLAALQLDPVQERLSYLLGEYSGVDSGRVPATLAGGPSEARGTETPTPVVEPTELNGLAPRRITDFFKFRPGDELVYYVVGAEGAQLTFRSYRVMAESGPGRYLVEVMPGGRRMTWIVDEEENAFYWEFKRLDFETGEESIMERVLQLRLPTTAGPVGAFADRRLLPETKTLVTNIRSYEHCLVVEFDEGEVQRHRHYYCEGFGLVGIETYELRSAAGEKQGSPQCVFRRYLQERRTFELQVESGGIGTPSKEKSE